MVCCDVYISSPCDDRFLFPSVSLYQNQVGKAQKKHLRFGTFRSVRRCSFSFSSREKLNKSGIPTYTTAPVSRRDGNTFPAISMA